MLLKKKKKKGGGKRKRKGRRREKRREGAEGGKEKKKGAMEKGAGRRSIMKSLVIKLQRTISILSGNYSLSLKQNVVLRI
jgi:hypothetical protein